MELSTEKDGETVPERTVKRSRITDGAPVVNILYINPVVSSARDTRVRRTDDDFLDECESLLRL